MRILFLYPRSLDAKYSIGGVAEFLCSITPELKALDVESIIYSGDKKAKTLTQPEFTLATTTVYNGPFLKPGWWVNSRKLSHAIEVCHKEKIDLIHAQGTYTSGFMAAEIHQRTGIPFVVTSHSDILATNSKRMRRRNVQRRCQHVLKQAAAVTHLTPMMESFSHALFDTSAKSTVIGNGIDCKAWLPFVNNIERSYLLGIGRLERGKGFHILIDMFAELIRRGIKTSLVIAGKGSEEPALLAQAKQHGLNTHAGPVDINNIPEKSVIFCGYIRDDAKKQLIAESQLILFATQPQLWEEAFGIVQLEAMAAGKAILASNTQVTEYLEQAGMQCSRVEPENITAWVNQAEKLLKDAELRKKMGQANLLAVSQFDWQPIAKQYRDVYASVVA